MNYSLKTYELPEGSAHTLTCKAKATSGYNPRYVLDGRGEGKFVKKQYKYQLSIKCGGYHKNVTLLIKLERRSGKVYRDVIVGNTSTQRNTPIPVLSYEIDLHNSITPVLNDIVTFHKMEKI